jgi:hypothetical protein
MAAKTKDFKAEKRLRLYPGDPQAAYIGGNDPSFTEDAGETIPDEEQEAHDKRYDEWVASVEAAEEHEDKVVRERIAAEETARVSLETTSEAEAAEIKAKAAPAKKST